MSAVAEKESKPAKPDHKLVEKFKELWADAFEAAKVSAEHTHTEGWRKLYTEHQSKVRATRLTLAKNLAGVAETLERLMFVGLNPSTADEERDDPTIRRCIGFAKRENCGGINMLNLFAFRATKPADMFAAADPIGPENDGFLTRYRSESSRVVAAWGVHGWFGRRAEVVARMLSGMTCLGMTKEGHPRHPLYVQAGTPLEAWPRVVQA